MIPGVFIGIPTFDGRLDWTTMKGLVQVAHFLGKKGFPFATDVIPGDHFIGKARSTIVHRFLESQMSELVFLDADVGFDLGAFSELMRADVDIAMGLYRVKQDTLKFPALMYDPPIQNEKDPKLIKLQYGPAGFMKVRRHVFEKMAETYPDDWFTASEAGQSKDRIHDFFPCGRVGNHFVGEDIGFCERAIKCGFDIWAVQGVTLMHTGMKRFDAKWQVMHAVEEAA